MDSIDENWRVEGIDLFLDNWAKKEGFDSCIKYICYSLDRNWPIVFSNFETFLSLRAEALLPTGTIVRTSDGSIDGCYLINEEGKLEGYIMDYLAYNGRKGRHDPEEILEEGGLSFSWEILGGPFKKNFYERFYNGFKVVGR